MIYLCFISLVFVKQVKLTDVQRETEREASAGPGNSHPARAVSPGTAREAHSPPKTTDHKSLKNKN